MGGPRPSASFIFAVRKCSDFQRIGTDDSFLFNRKKKSKYLVRQLCEIPLTCLDIERKVAAESNELEVSDGETLCALRQKTISRNPK